MPGQRCWIEAVPTGYEYLSLSFEECRSDIVSAAECVSEHGKEVCKELGGTCVTEQDGYYYVSAICLILGALSVLFYITPTAKRLEGLPLTKWRVSGPK
jgi:PAT family acetyl-CoA transporter-like MFS transporter 1